MFTNNFREILKDKEMVPGQLVKETGLSNVLYRAYGDKDYIPTIPNCIKICKALNIPLHKLISGLEDWV